MKYKVKINVRNKMFDINGKLVRTPVEFISSEKKIGYIKSKLRAEGILDYSIEEINS